MGADQSSPKNEQRSSRNVSRSEVEAALEAQRQVYEQQMRNMLQNQTVTRSTQQNTSTAQGSAGQSSAAVPPTRPAPRPHVETAVEPNFLERQRNPYSYTQNNLNNTGRSSPLTNTSRPLYPNLNDNAYSHLSSGNNNHIRQSLGTNQARQSPGTNQARQGPENPNLNDSVYSHLSPGNNNHIRQSLGTNQARQSPVHDTGNDFVFVNSNLKAERFTPSAPPAPSIPPSRQRQRSASRHRPNSEPVSEINCPTCKNRFGVKIFNCHSGHASCMNCRMQQRPCGVCGAMITQMRNISVEEYVLELKGPCVNANEGCLLNFKLSEMEQHGKECPFRETQCLLPGGLCHWKGKLSQLATHFENFHPDFKGDVDTEMSLDLPNSGETKKMKLIKIGTFNFLFHLIASTSKNKMYVAVQLLGTKTSAAKWSYEIHLYDKGAPRRKYQYTDKCLSNADSLEDIMYGNNCAVLPLQYAKTFINYGAINYKFFIKREFSATNESQRERDTSGTRRGGRRGRGAFRKF